MNILIIHEIDFFRKVVFEFHTLAELLSLAGHNVYVIDYESMWIKKNLLDFGTLRTKEVNVARAYPEALVKLIRPGFIKIPILSRMSAFLTHYWAIKRAIMEKKIDVIILYSVPTNGIQTVRLAKNFSVPVVFRSIDTLHQLVSNPILSKITYCMEKFVYSRADLVLTISPQLSEYVIGMGASNVELLPLGVDTDLFHPDISSNGIRHKWGLNDKDKVIVFVGTLPMFSGLDTFIPKFSYVLNEFPNAKLMIVGDGVQRPWLQGIIKTAGLEDHVIITGLQPHEFISQYINSADVCINTFPVSGATKDAFPTKIIQYMACGKPTVSLRLLGLKNIGQKQGIVYADNGIEFEIISLLKSDDRRQKLGQAALNYVRQTHSYDSVIKQLEYELEKLVKYEYSSTKSQT